MGILAIFILALILRLILAPLGFHVDILSNAGWGEWIYTHGPFGFYENNIWTFSWPTQPPFVSLIYGFDNFLYINLLEAFRSIGHTIVKYHLAPGHMVWWFNFTKWFDTAKVSIESSFYTGYLVTIKLLPIVSDLGIAGLIYWVAKQIKKVRYPLAWASIYLFSPFSWYLSSLWGQYDQLAFLPVLLAFILLSQNRLQFLTPVLLAIGIAIKPTSLILVPFFIYIYIKNSPKKLSILFSLLLITTFFAVTTQVFTDQNLFVFTKETLIQKIFFKASSRLSVNAFNFWRLTLTNGLESQEKVFFLLPAVVWSTLAYIFLNFFAAKKTKTINTKNVLTGVFIVSAGSFLFMTNMLDRYFFAGIVTGLFTCLYYPKIFKFWLPLSFIFFINLYNQWWFPEWLSPLENILIWQGGAVTKVLSIINIFLFVIIVSEVNKSTNK